MEITNVTEIYKPTINLANPDLECQKGWLLSGEVCLKIFQKGTGMTHIGMNLQCETLGGRSLIYSNLTSIVGLLLLVDKKHPAPMNYIMARVNGTNCQVFTRLYTSVWEQFRWKETTVPCGQVNE